MLAQKDTVTYSSSAILILISSGPLHHNPGPHELSAIFLAYCILQDDTKKRQEKHAQSK